MKLLKLLWLTTFICFFSCSTSNNENEVVEELEEIQGTKTTEGIKYGANFLVFEPEITKSDLDLWVKRIPGDENYYVGDGLEAINKGYLEFNGRSLGKAKSPLEYIFKAPSTGKYGIAMRMYQPLQTGDTQDLRNDVWIKLAGDFTTACIFPTEVLEHDIKFFGKGINQWGSLYAAEGHIGTEKKISRITYNLKKDEIYTFTMSGRGDRCSVDYILFFDTSLGIKIERGPDLAIDLPEIYRPETN